MNIDTIAQKIITSFNAEDFAILEQETKNMLYLINREEGMFSCVSQPFLVAKSLYFMLADSSLSEDDQTECVKLAYFCLLNNYLNTCDSRPGSPEYENLVSGCKLALVLITMQSKFLMYSVIAGEAQYINPQTHMRNQLLLFGGIVKEAKNAHFNFLIEEIVSKYFMDIYNELESYLPVGSSLLSLKEKYTQIINNIMTSIRINLNDDWLDDF